MRAVLAALLLFAALAGPAFAIEADEQLANPALEARARALGAELRCLVCADETIDASQAPLAADLRKLIRERIVAGDSDTQIRDMLVARYGEYVLFRPRFDARNAALWLVPFAVLIVGGAVLVLRTRRMRQGPSEPPPLSPEEAAELEAILKDKAETP